MKKQKLFISLSPRVILGYTFAFSIIFAIASLWLAIQEPIVGITWKTNQNSTGLVVSAIKKNSSAEKSSLKVGTTINSISSSASPIIKLKANDILEEPDIIVEYPSYNDFLQRQQQLHNHLQAEKLNLITDKGDSITLSPQTRSVFDLPFMYWFQLFCGIIAMLTGVSILVFRKTDTAAIIYALTGFSLLLTTFISAIYSTRELALSGLLFRVLESLNHLGSLIFTAMFAAIFWYYPQRIKKIPVALILFVVYLLIWAGDTFQLLPDTDTSIRLPILIGLILSFIFAIAQWFLSSKKPVERAALKWFILSILVGGSLFVIALFILRAQYPTLEIAQGYSFGLLLIMYLGIALGIQRYGLFKLGSWWTNVWAWILGGVAVISFDLLLVSFLHLQESVALGASLALAGWLYFPFRQWLFSITAKNNKKEQNIEAVLPQLVSLVIKHDGIDKLSHDWKGFLQNIFSPLYIDSKKTQLIDETSIDRDGLKLIIPDVDPSLSLELAYPDQGGRLYNKKDLKLAKSLAKIFKYALNDLDAFEKGVTEERKRLARDLHDDIGSRLLSLVHRTENTETAEIAQKAMSDLRIVLTNLDGKPRLLEDSIADWRDEWEQRCYTKEIKLVWDDAEIMSDLLLSARQYANTLRILRELLNNIIRHAEPSNIEFSSTSNDSAYTFVIQHDGDFESPDTWKKGRGSLSMLHRAEELGGSILFILSDTNQKIQITLNIPFLNKELM